MLDTNINPFELDDIQYLNSFKYLCMICINYNLKDQFIIEILQKLKIPPKITTKRLDAYYNYCIDNNKKTIYINEFDIIKNTINVMVENNKLKNISYIIQNIINENDENDENNDIYLRLKDLIKLLKYMLISDIPLIKNLLKKMKNYNIIENKKTNQSFIDAIIKVEAVISNKDEKAVRELFKKKNIL